MNTSSGNIVLDENHGLNSWNDQAQKNCDRIAHFLTQGSFRCPVIFCISPSYFWEALSTCWRLGLVPVIPPDIQPANLEQMRSSGVDALLSDIVDLCQNVPPVPFLFLPSTSGALADFGTSPPHCWLRSDVALYLFTSGSSGTRRMIAKTFAQLWDEVEVLDQMWGEECREKRIVATVSHQHIYGLLFTILWPVRNGKKVAQSRIFHWEELPTSLGMDFLLASSPTHLALLAQGEVPLPWTGASIFSSGGLLRHEAAVGVFRRTGIWVREIYGSTETGGMAWRTQASGKDSRWTPLPGVRSAVDEDGRLMTTSPWSDNLELHLCGDKAARFDDGTFLLQGRADRLVKVFEKRVNLTEMERILTELPEVLDVRVFPAPDTVRDGHLCCAISPRQSDVNRTEFLQRLKFVLRRHFEPAQIPRHWYVGNLPYNPQGKLALVDLERLLFAPSHSLVPQTRALDVSSDCIQVDLLAPSDYYYLQGHFPNVPVVPGVCQLKWVLDLVEKHWGDAGWRVEGRLKFSNILPPERQVHLRIDRLSGGLKFQIADAQKKYSSGRLHGG
ncbi:MAG TPA: AMP-binding protein [Fibrobacteraceae bacterium]|nr:AMP-binding protein [Fibrobacteraceae bacterium]